MLGDMCSTMFDDDNALEKKKRMVLIQSESNIINQYSAVYDTTRYYKYPISNPSIYMLNK